MKAKEIYSRTMPFVWAKLMLGVITVLASLILLGIMLGITWLFRSEGVAFVMIILWLGLTGIIRFFLMHYVGYLVKAGHIAVMTEAITTGQIPPNQVEYGKQMVKERFVTSNVYFAIDKLVGAAVKQIQKGIGKLGSTLSFIPGMSAATGLAQYFVSLSLGYIDECCLGYTFYKKEQGAYKSAADGVAIYTQNIKALLGSAAKTMLYVILAIVGITLGSFIILGVLFRLFSWPGWIAFAISLFLALVIKFAFIDSFVLARTMVAYMSVAPTTVITIDIYGQLCKVSSKFKELFNKGQEEQPGGQAAPAGPAIGLPAGQAQAESQDEKPQFCGQCGAKNNRGVKFCGTCGAAMK